LYDPGRVAGQARGHNEPHERGVPQERAAVRPSHAELRPVDLHTRWFTLLLPLLPRSRQAPLGAWGTSAPGAVPARRPAAPGAANTTRAGAGAARREPGARAKRSGRAACSGGALMRFVRRRAVLERVRGVHQRVRPPSRPYLVWLSVAWYLVCTRFFITPSLSPPPPSLPIPLTLPPTVAGLTPASPLRCAPFPPAPSAPRACCTDARPPRRGFMPFLPCLAPEEARSMLEGKARVFFHVLAEGAGVLTCAAPRGRVGDLDVAETDALLGEMAQRVLETPPSSLPPVLTGHAASLPPY